MSLAAPWMLWSLLALLPLAAVYLLKVRPRRRPTTAYFLWQGILAERRASALWTRLRDILSFLILALTLGFLSLGLARPYFAAEERDLLILVDTSASMAARDGGSTRLAQAQEQARQLVRALGAEQRAVVASIDSELRYLVHSTPVQRELLAGIDQLSINPVPLDAGLLRRLVDDMIVSEGLRTLFLSDGVFRRELHDGRVLAALDWMPLGAGSQDKDIPGNVGIVAADLQPRPGGGYDFFVRLASSHRQPLQVDLRLSHGSRERMLRVLPLKVKPGLNEAHQFFIEGGGPGRWWASLHQQHSDALASDDVAYLVVPEPQPLHVAISGRQGDWFYRQCIQALAAAGDLLRPSGLDQADLLLSEGGVNEQAALHIIFAPNEADSPWWQELGDPLHEQAVLPSAEEHPMLRHLDLLGLSFIGARSLRAPPGALVLAAAEDSTPLLYIARAQGQRALVINGDPLRSGLVLSPAFPILIHQAVAHLGGRDDALYASQRSIDSLPLIGLAEGEPGQLTRADGHSQTLRGGQRPVAGPPGFAQLLHAQGSADYGISLFSAVDSLLQPARLSPAEAPPPGGRPWAFWLFLCALLLLLAELHLYHRRKVG